MDAPGARNVPLERKLTHGAAEAARIDPGSFLAFCESRAGDAPVRGLPARNLIHEALEEQADARNYIVWRVTLEYTKSTPDGELIEALLIALQAVLVAAQYLTRARELCAGS